MNDRENGFLHIIRLGAEMAMMAYRSMQMAEDLKAFIENVGKCSASSQTTENVHDRKYKAVDKEMKKLKSKL
jgi:hypothetical protein